MNIEEIENKISEIVSLISRISFRVVYIVDKQSSDLKLYSDIMKYLLKEFSYYINLKDKNNSREV